VTPTDRYLLQRVARTLEADAKVELDSYSQDWLGSQEAKAAKGRYDRLMRDARDLRDMVTRESKAEATGANQA
jgi:hypothetical protein